MKPIEEQLEDYKKFNVAKNNFIAGIIMGWASSIELAHLTHDTKETVRVIKDMKELSTTLAKSGGVIIADEMEDPNDPKN